MFSLVLIPGIPIEKRLPAVPLADADRRLLPMGETVTRYHVAIDVDDRAGVLAAVATAFADHGVSVARKVTYLATGEWEPIIAID